MNGSSGYSRAFLSEIVIGNIFAIVGGAVLIIALLYAELAAAMPQVGGEHAYSLKLLISGDIAGVITSWNGFLVGGSRAIYALAKSKMLPDYFAALHPQFNTPYRAIVAIGVIAAVAPGGLFWDGLPIVPVLPHSSPISWWQFRSWS